ncbi:MAG: cupin domain-containing protein, partial [Gammaproteobacteria bacterium]|nr:cupin domain-containing protein [Gammaproteobacteria bacterium]
MPESLASRLVCYSDLKPCTTAFVDTRTPGSDEKENFTIIGPGVSESPDQYVHIDLPHGFNIGAARQPPGCVNSQHSHETAEVFVIHSGRWAFRLGPEAKDGEVVLEPGDTISIPIHVFRGFENVGDVQGFMFAVLGGDDPGHVTWAPYVFEAAEAHGLVL